MQKPEPATSRKERMPVDAKGEPLSELSEEKLEAVIGGTYIPLKPPPKP